MDTYVHVSYEKCQKCGLCVEACPYNMLYGGRNHIPDCWSDNPRCHVCEEQSCKKVCYYNAISWSRS